MSQVPMTTPCPPRKRRRGTHRRLGSSPSSHKIATIPVEPLSSPFDQIISTPMDPTVLDSPTSSMDADFVHISPEFKHLPYITNRIRKDSSIARQNLYWWNGPRHPRVNTVGPFLSVPGPATHPFQSTGVEFPRPIIDVHVLLSFHALFGFLADKTIGYLRTRSPADQWGENIDLTFYNSTLDTTQLLDGSIRSVGEVALAAITAWPLVKQRRSRWTVVLYRDITRQNLGDTWFAILVDGEDLPANVQ